MLHALLNHLSLSARCMSLNDILLKDHDDTDFDLLCELEGAAVTSNVHSALVFAHA
jgi:hypothetical protein